MSPAKSKAANGNASSSGDTDANSATSEQRTPSRLSQAWVTLAVFAVILILLLVFILQNLHDTKISYLGAHGSLPLGVLMLIGALAGIVLAVLLGTLRIVQLKVRARRASKQARN